MFNLVLVTPPTTSGHEQAMLPKLFEAGLQRLHVRKKDLSHEQLAAYLQNIPNAYRRFVVLHQHHDLVPAMNLGGIHYTERDAPTSPISGLPGRTISLAYHQPSQLLACRGAVDYCFLSPVYPSISKPGYQPPQDLADRRALSEYVHLARYPVIALGGASFLFVYCYSGSHIKLNTPNPILKTMLVARMRFSTQVSHQKTFQNSLN